MPIVQTRRRFLTNAAGAGAAGLGGFGACGKALAAAEPPPEITTIRFEKDRGTCIAPQVVQELLRAEGQGFRAISCPDDECRRTDHGLGRAASRVLRDLRKK
jgi:hypothetical protein